jgi:cysteine-rich repeat protein
MPLCAVTDSPFPAVRPLFPAGRTLLFVCLAVVAQTTDARASSAAACVSAADPNCKDSNFLSSSVVNWGSRQYEGGGQIHGFAQSDARGLRALFSASTENGGSALVGGNAVAAFTDSQVHLDAPGTPVIDLEFYVVLSGAFSGADFGPPCEHCGGESPWVATGSATASAEVFATGQDKKVTLDTEWNSNAGVTNPLEGAGLMAITVNSGEVYTWSTALNVGATAGNPPCLSGAGTCGFPGGAYVDGEFRNTLRMYDFRAYDHETHEEIFDFTLTGSNGIDYLAIDRGCGNGTLDEGEECDDANIDAGDCCSPGCKIETGACNDHDACTGDGVCDGAQCAGAERFSCPLPCGDANASGSLGAVDALIALRTAVETGDCEDCRCNTNHDGGVTSVDALKILQRAVGIDVMLDCPECVPDF